MKRMLVLLVALAIALLNVEALAETVEYKGEINIGLCFGQTGANALVGVAYCKGITEAIDEVNAAGGVQGYKVNTILIDSGDDADTAMNAMNLLVEEDVVAILGPHFSSQDFAVQSIIESSGIPTVVGGTNYKLPSADNHYMFLGRTNDTIQAKVLANYMVENKKPTKVGILYSSDDFGQGGMEVAAKALDEAGVPHVEEPHGVNDTDYYSTLLKMQQAGCDAYFCWTPTTPMTLIVRQMYELGIPQEASCFFGPGLGDNALQDALDHSWLDGLYCVQETFNDMSNPDIAAYVESFKANYGTEPDSPARCWGTVAFMLLDAIGRAEDPTDREAVRTALEETEGVETIYCKYTCDELHMLNHSISICQYDSAQDGLTFITLFEA